MSRFADRHWVFDMDGTLTLAVHDYAFIRDALEIPADQDILAFLDRLPAEESARRHAWLLEHEQQLSRQTRQAPGAERLLQALAADGCRIGLLTRNARPVARQTLEQLGLLHYFDPQALYAREDARPKPDPDGLLRLATHWAVPASRLNMVGDYSNDLQAARAAGARSILVGPENRWPQITDHHFSDCHALLEAFRQQQ